VDNFGENFVCGTEACEDILSAFFPSAAQPAHFGELFILGW